LHHLNSLETMIPIRKVVAVVSEAQKPLREIFVSSWKDDIPLEIVSIEIEGSGDFRSAGWYDAIRQQQVIARNQIEENLGSIIIVADIDIQFFGKTRSLVESVFDDGYDICFQAEKAGTIRINTGFVAILCSPATLIFYNEMSKADLSQYRYADQTWVSQNIRASGLRWRVFPTSIYAWSQSGPNVPADILLHHANCTGGGNGLARKLSQMAFVRQRVAALRKSDGSVPNTVSPDLDMK
jgi:hypothetical protein